MEVPISLYIKTASGVHPDLRVAAKSALIFADIVERVARTIDPDLEVHVEIVSGSEGSFGLNTLSKIAERAKVVAANAKQGVLDGWRKHEKARFLAAYVAIRILDNSISWSQDQIMDWLASNDAPAVVQELDVEQRRALAADIAEELRRDTGDDVDRLYSQMARDVRIEGVGVTALPGPAEKVLPRSEFIDSVVEIEDNDRVVRERLELRLVSPVLELGDRRWKLRGPHGEFGAPIKDKEFLQSVIAGETNLHLRGGVILDAEISTLSRLVDGVWEVQLRTVEKVHGWREGPVQDDLLGTTP